MDDASGELDAAGLRVEFDRRLNLEFHGSKVTAGDRSARAQGTRRCPRPDRDCRAGARRHQDRQERLTLQLSHWSQIRGPLHHAAPATAIIFSTAS